VPGAWGDEDGVAWGDGAGGAVDFHFGGAFKDEVKFFANAMVVAFGGAAGGEGGLGEGLVLDWGVGEVEQAADGGAVFGGEGGLGGEGTDDHRGEIGGNQGWLQGGAWQRVGGGTRKNQAGELKSLNCSIELTMLKVFKQTIKTLNGYAKSSPSPSDQIVSETAGSDCRRTGAAWVSCGIA